MSGVAISSLARSQVLIREFVRNGKAPVAELQNKLTELCGHAVVANTRQLFVRSSPLIPLGASAGSSATTRWRFAAHSHPYPLYWFVRMHLAPQDNGTPSSPYTVLDIADSADPGTVVATARVDFGTSDGTFDDVPVNFGNSLAVLTAPGGGAWTIDPNTTYLGRFYDVNYARLFAACVYEVSLDADTDNGFAPISSSFGAPVYYDDRETPIRMARSVFMNAQAPLWNWGSDNNADAPSRDSEASLALALESTYVDGLGADEETFSYIRTEEDRGVRYMITVSAGGAHTDVEVIFTLPYRTADDAGLVIASAFSGNMAGLETALATANSGWTVDADDSTGAGPLVLTFTRATLAAGDHDVLIGVFDGGETADYPIGEWRWGTSSTPASGTAYYETDIAIGFELSGGSNEIATATGGINQQIEVGDLYNVFAVTPDPVTEGDEVILDNTVFVYSNDGGGTLSMQFQITTAVTCSEPTIDSNPDSFSLSGSWSSPGGGIQWQGTFVKTSGVASEGEYRLALATTPSTDGTLVAIANSSWTLNPYTDSETDSITVDPAPSWTLDATSGLGTPLTEAEAEAVLSDAGVASPNVTNLWLFGTPASGNISDVIGSKTLTASGTWSYQQAVTGWSLQALESTAGTAARVLNTTFSNVNANSYVVFLLFAHLPAATGTRTLFRFGDTFDDDACVEITSSGTDVLNVGEGDGTRTAGSSDFTGAARWAVLRIDDTANTVDLFTTQDKIIGGTQACNGTELCFGGDNNQTWRPGDTNYMLSFIHTGTMTNTEIKAALTSLGYSPGWTP